MLSSDSEVYSCKITTFKHLAPSWQHNSEMEQKITKKMTKYE